MQAPAGEVFVYRSGKVKYTIKMDGTTSGPLTGTFQLSQFRLLFIADAAGPADISVPLHCIFDEDIRQPIFGATNLRASIETPADGAGSLHVVFNSGGIDGFVRAFLPIMGEVARRRDHQMRNGARNADGVSASAPVADAAVPSRVAYVDANNGTNVFVPH
eukprot:NODE_2160_length_624_cov_13.982609_g1700_i0.p1 GENE.NODE_2160_length_624_cov_13.982609_g1700_i0~~NODE_2160_length_624_cov_13.982609_g1700_i0.p1  ORF type:complete len:187 (-),score=45.50 NODE_2160_length_624_cov_13.982609_g1700_i0:63-545(-)